MPRIIPSIASGRMLDVAAIIQKLGRHGTLHIDIEDGNFVPNITFGLKMVEEIGAVTKMPLNVHLLVTNPIEYIDRLAKCGVGEIAFHIESTPYPLQIINRIKSFGIKAGLALNIATPIQTAEPFKEDLDFVLVMTSEEDGMGQKFHPSSLSRLHAARSVFPPGISLWADGGIRAHELRQVCKMGADTIVMGRAVMNASDPKKTIDYFTTFC